MEKEQIVRELQHCNTLEQVWSYLDINREDYKRGRIKRLFSNLIAFVIGVTLPCFINTEVSIDNIYYGCIAVGVFVSACILTDFILRPCSTAKLEKQFRVNKSRAINRALEVSKEKDKRNNR